MTKRDTEILIRNGYMPLPEPKGNQLDMSALGTVMSNLTYYGYSFSEEAFNTLKLMSIGQVGKWWTSVEPILKSLTGDDKNLDEHVVYKNFPQEVLDMTEGEYWFNQILMYWGLPNELFTQDPVAREDMTEKRTFKVLRPQDPKSLEKIFNNLLAAPFKWTKEQEKDVMHLSSDFTVDLSQIPFKENMVTLATKYVSKGNPVKFSSATDVLRLIASLSKADVSLKETFRPKNFKRSQRKILLEALSNTSNPFEDFKRYPGLWKKALRALRPGDYAKKYPRVVAAYDMLYNNKLPRSFNSQVEEFLAKGDKDVLLTLQTRPGEFTRRLAVCLNKFGGDAAHAYVDIVPKLTTIQLLKIEKFLETAKSRKTRMYPPKGNWSKVQVKQEEYCLPQDAVDVITSAISVELAERIPAVNLDRETSRIKLQTNDNELAPYGRGTSFPIPDEVKFVRSASYWHTGKTYNSIWYDNGWNFFDSDWNSKGAVCWNQSKYTNGRKTVAAFSGDPTNSKTDDGKACQLIDIYLDNMKAAGIRYAVWNVLCYSRQKFSEAKEVFAALQWGEDANKGKLFEPSRAQLSFPLAGDNYTKYVAYIDVEKRELVYMDANFQANVHSAASNGSGLESVMPAYVEYLNALPSVHDLFKSSQGGDIPVVYSDKEINLDKEQEAFVFRAENVDNDFTNFDINKLLGE